MRRRRLLLVLVSCVEACGAGATHRPDAGARDANAAAPDRATATEDAAGALDSGLPEDTDATADDAAAPRDGEPQRDAFEPPAAPVLGATVDPTGVTFRVWAPNADEAYVAGEFNGFSGTMNPLLPEPIGGGIFAGRVEGARPGQRYHYVFSTHGERFVRADPRGRQETAFDGDTIIVDPNAFEWRNRFAAPPVNQQVIYELHVGTFNPPRGRVGSFLSVIPRLDHLAALGVNMIELMPPAQFPGTRSWGYNPAQPFAVATAYGASDDLKRLIDEAHGRGIGVIIDVVHNHWGRRTPTLWCFDGDCLGSGNGGIYFYTNRHRSTPWGPRPDFGRAEVRQYVLDDTLLWANEYNADGLRWDSVLNIRSEDGGAAIPEGLSLLQTINDAVHRLPKRFLQIAEDLHTVDSVTQTTQQRGAGFDTQWDAAFFHPIDDNIIKPNDADRDMQAVKNAILHTYNGHALERVIYTEDHDEVANGRKRIPAMITPSDPGSLLARKRSTLGAAIVFTSPGIPMIFMGQEFLEDGYFADTRPLDWSKTSTYAGVLRLYTDLIRLRRNRGGTTLGLTGARADVYHLNAGAKVIAYRRFEPGSGGDVVVLANFSNHPFPIYTLGFPRAGVWHVRFNSDSTVYSGDFGNMPSNDVTASATPRDGQPASGNVALGAYAVVILSM